MANPYTTTTFGVAKTLLAQLLGNPTKTFFTDLELGTYLKEALTTWGAATFFYRNRANFSTTSSQAFYNLPAYISDLNFITTNRDLASSLEYSLMEPQTSSWTVWTGTEQFSLSDLSQAIQRARDQFLLATGMILTTQEILTSSPPVSRVALPEAVLDLYRVASKSISNNYRVLSEEDELTLGAYSPEWNLPSVSPTQQPDYYSEIVDPLLTIQLAPVATDITALHLIYVAKGSTLSLSSSTLLGIPEAFTWVIKYGALYELLGPHTQCHDPIRADYCKMRWLEGIQLAKLYSSILNAEINGLQANISTISELDQYQWNWQNSSGIPSQIAMVGWNLVALADIPNSTPTSIVVDYLCNPIMPIDDTTSLQIDEAYLPIILDYSRHLAMFKRGGKEFVQSQQGYDRLIQAAAFHNARLRAQSVYFSSLIDNVTRQNEQSPRVDIVDDSMSQSQQQQ